MRESNMVGSDESKSKYSIVCWLILMGMVIATTFTAAEDCETDLRGLEIECLYYMHKGEPSTLMNPNKRCCDVIQQANLPCCCANLNRKLSYPPGFTIEDLLDWGKVLHTLNFCGKPLAVGTKCGMFHQVHHHKSNVN
ncbi:hypothetical protein Ahy_A01g004493 [Arachis hypogaea]|uniref:Bifunctional inhibitor/plant lipid transfer protein/seed storage helical domain-containing protein n=1 Tax=Arachis hypogaea TaxID=3818 RepID=A0A445EW75_ARAHY|nr:hypothetical protein Ahy_A01g004493 [Arachis hypogaea]